MEKQKQNTELAKYKEVLEKVLFKKDFYKNEYPTHRVSVELVSYTGENLVKNEVNSYSWLKIFIRNTKLTLNKNEVETKKKLVWNNIVDDETIVKILVDDFDEIIQHFKNLDTKNETSVDLKSKKTTKIDDEIKIEDIPF